MMLTNAQLTAICERVATVAVSYAIGYGVIDAGDAQVWTGLLVAIVSGGFALWQNRAKRIAEKAAAAGMTVIAPPDIADTTKSPAIVSSTRNVVVPKP